jgi:hypothetical protein
MKPCPCGCTRQLGWADGRAAKSAGEVVRCLPYVHRLSRVLEATNPREAKTALAFVQQGVEYALGVLQVAHGDHSPSAQRSMPSIAEGASWLRRAGQLRPDIQTLDTDWWFWFKRRGEPVANLDVGRSWNGQVRGSGPPEPPIGGSLPAPSKNMATANVEVNGDAGEIRRDPVKVGPEFPRIKALLRVNLVHWGIVRDRINDLVPLVRRNSPVWYAFEVEVGQLEDMAKGDPRSTEWIAQAANKTRLLAALSSGYGVGRLALGTVDEVRSRAEALAPSDIDGLASAMSFKEVVACSINPSALAAAVWGVSAEDAKVRLQDPVERFETEASQRGFLLAVAEEALLDVQTEEPEVLTTGKTAESSGQPETPMEILTAQSPALLEAYGRARSSNKPLDSLFAAIDEVIGEDHRVLVREFALGEHDNVFGEGAGYRATAPLLPGFDELSGYTQTQEVRTTRWLGMNIVDLAEELGSDPLLTDMFLWTMHHNMDDDGARLITNASVVLVSNAKSARTGTGSKVKIEQAVHVLRLLSRKAHQSDTEHQEMWCTAVANVIAKHAK